MLTGVSSLSTLKAICTLLANGLGKIVIESLPNDTEVFADESVGFAVVKVTPSNL